MAKIIFSCVLFCLIANHAYSDSVTRILDTGQGLATITKFSNGQVMLYDTGHWNSDDKYLSEVACFLGEDEKVIDLLILSHSDADHIAGTNELFSKYLVKKVIRTGHARNSNTWVETNLAINTATANKKTIDINLSNTKLKHGTTYSFGESKLTILSGFHKTPETWNITDKSELRNANSIVTRLSLENHSILFTGDAVGRKDHNNHKKNDALGTEKYLIDNKQARPIKSTVMIAPHHGSLDASSFDFIKEVNPTYVIFSAGRGHGHPKNDTVLRYLESDIKKENIFRTDTEDNEGDGEWLRGSGDKSGDDSIDIVLNKVSPPNITYFNHQNNCT